MTILTCPTLALRNLDQSKLQWLKKEGAVQGDSCPGWEEQKSAVCIRRASLWSDCRPQGPFSTKALPPSLFKGFLKCGSSPPHLSRAVCRCHTLHRALALQNRLSCCPLVPFPRHRWGWCDTPRYLQGKDFCLLSSHPHHCQDDLQFLASVYYHYLSSFCLGNNFFWQRCQAVLGGDEPGVLVMEGSKC